MVELVAQDNQLATFVARGQLTPEDVVAVYTDFINLAPAPCVLWDLSSANLDAFDTRGIWDLAQRVARMGKDRRFGGKTALVCTRDLEFGIARMLAIFLAMERYAVNVQVFRSAKEAEAWLLRPVAHR